MLYAPRPFKRACRQRSTGARRLDPTVEQALQPATLKAYKNALRRFHKSAVAHNVFIAELGVLDDFSLEYKNDFAWAQIHGPVTKSQFELLLAATYKLFPDSKVMMHQSKEVLKSWRVVVVPRHTRPMSKVWAHHLSKKMRRRHGWKKASLLPMQYHFCLRPTEARNLRGRDLLSEAETTVPGMVGVLLGTRVRTKVKRTQVSRSTDPIAVALVNAYKEHTAPDELLCDTSAGQYSKMIKDAMVECAVTSARWTPHGPRSGKASDMYLANVPFTEIREHGRWAHDGSLRIYLDIAGALNAQINKELADARAAALASELSFLPLF